MPYSSKLSRSSKIFFDKFNLSLGYPRIRAALMATDYIDYGLQNGVLRISIRRLVVEIWDVGLAPPDFYSGQREAFGEG